MPTAEEILRNRPVPSSDKASISEYVGQVIELTGAVFESGRYESVTLTIVTPAGEEEEIWSSSKGVVETARYLVDNGADFPASLKVVTGMGTYGKPWYDLEPVTA